MSGFSRDPNKYFPFAIPTATEMALSNEYYARLNQTPLPAGDACAEINAAADRELVARDAFDAAEDRWLAREDS